MDDMAYVAYCGYCKLAMLFHVDNPEKRVETFWVLRKELQRRDRLTYIPKAEAVEILKVAEQCQCSQEDD